jgi:hypothetical protein
MELPAEFYPKPSGKRKLSDGQVIFARENIARLGCRALAKRFNVSYGTMWNAIKGYSFRHLNGTFPPQW